MSSTILDELEQLRQSLEHPTPLSSSGQQLDVHTRAHHHAPSALDVAEVRDRLSTPSVIVRLVARRRSIATGV